MAEETKKKAETKPTTVTLTIDGRETTVPRGTSVLEAAKAMGIDIPTFCWHPKLKSVGACRMCYVEIEKHPKLEVSCATEAMEGMVVRTNSDKVLRGRKAVIEFILLNHPLDCPTCDKGGECTLQNLTLAHGFDDSRFEFQKSRFVDEGMTTTFDDLRIGPEVILNRNRCILCYKCVRANKEAFGEYDLGVYERGNVAEINAAPGRQVANPFSGNLIEICPVGALTSDEWRYKIRVWLTQTAASICNFTSSGSNITLYKDPHKNRLYRATSSCRDDIDDGWLSDVTRYGYQMAISPERLKTPLIKKEGRQVEATWEEALNLVHKRLAEIKEKKGGVCIGGLTKPSLDNDSLYAFSKFFRTALNSNNVDFRQDYKMLPSTESVFGALCRQKFTIADIDDSDVIVVFGSDMICEHANEYLRVRKAYNSGRAQIYSLNPYAVKSSDVADLELVYRDGADELVINGVCLAALEDGLTDDSAEALKQKLEPSNLAATAEACGVPAEHLKAVARALAAGRKVTFIIGELITRSPAREAIASALANLDRLFGVRNKGQLAVLAIGANSRGAERLGLMPQPPQTVVSALRDLWGSFPEGEGRNTDGMLALMRKEEIDGLFVLGANPVMLYPDRAFVKESLEKLDFLVACDLFETETTALADVVLPLCSWLEYDGSYVNLEGRTQSTQAALRPIGQARSGLEIVKAVADRFGVDLFENQEAAESEVERLLRAEEDVSLPNEFVEVKAPELPEDKEYRHPLYLVDDPHHAGHLTEKSPSLANFVGEAYIEISPAVASEYGLSSGDPVRVESSCGKLILPVKVSDWLKGDAVKVPRNFYATPVTSLLNRKTRVDRVKVSKVDE